MIYIKKGDLIVSWFCKPFRKHGAGICSALGEDWGSFYSWQKARQKQASCMTEQDQVRGGEVPHALKQADLMRTHSCEDSTNTWEAHPHNPIASHHMGDHISMWDCETNIQTM